MKQVTLAAVTPASTQAAWIWLGRLFRVMVVMLLIFDQVSSPLHNHHHDGGPDGVAPNLMMSSAHVSGSHIEQPEAVAASHAITAIKREVRRFPVSANADELPPVIIASLFQIFVGLKEALPSSWPVETRHVIVTHRSLPPGGRAPPLHT